MSTATTDAKKKKKVEVLVLELVDRRPSGYEKEGSRQEGMPIFLDSPSLQYILPRSVTVDKSGKLINLRYLKSGRDIYEEEQKKRNEEHNPQSDYIIFENGLLTVRNEGHDRNLYEYLRLCSFNRDAPGRYDEVTPIFYQVDAEAAAEEDNQDLEDLTDALKLATDLRTKKAEGGTLYEEEKIDMLVSLFNIQVDNDSYPIKFQSIVSIATTRPTWFKKMVEDRTAPVRVAIIQAREAGVITFDGDVASFIDNKRIFYSFTSKDLDTRISDLSNHFISKKGAADYKEMIIMLNTKKEDMMGRQ